ncbi:MAG: hypothetical protein PHT00_04325 [Candidatus Methanomethylophilus sp.]|nr:hypothetical protein [Methanomethylophilus sp.]MDD3233376.1 hypothetical protein [Methanomethylophilus sp.]MDD4222385.1 hypothetical protein [Methanomethylophilus sp.]MDD4668756.1 hypothetical protein [Methanomethylophilus sp.]
MNDNRRPHCKDCDTPLSPDDTVCPCCGRPVPDREQVAAPAKVPGLNELQRTIRNFGFMTSAYGIIALPVGLAFLYNGIAAPPYDTIFGVLTIASGLCALAGAVLMVLRIRGRAALTFLIAAAIASGEYVITLIVGLIVAFIAYDNRTGFESW